MVYTYPETGVSRPHPSEEGSHGLPEGASHWPKDYMQRVSKNPKEVTASVLLANQPMRSGTHGGR
jgi:hypothetical protein